MNLQVKREREETTTTTTVGGVGEEGSNGMSQQQQQQQPHAGVSPPMVLTSTTMESVTTASSAAAAFESRPAKLARRNDDRGVVEAGESLVEPSHGSCPIEDDVVALGEGEAQVRDPGRTDLQSGGKGNGEAVAAAAVNKELLGRVSVIPEEPEQLQKRNNSEVAVGQELVVDGNSSDGLRMMSPPEGNVADVNKDVFVDVKREEPPVEKKDDEKPKEDVVVLPLVQHLDVKIEKDNEKDSAAAEKGEKEKDSRVRDKEKEVVKRERREKARDRDPQHARRGESLLVDKEEGTPAGVNVVEDNIDVVHKKPSVVDERKLKEGRERVRSRDKERDDGDGEGGGKRKKRGREQEKVKERDFSLDTDGVGGEKEKDGGAHGHGVQQRRRMLRPRGQSTNASNRDSSRSRLRPKDNEGQDRANRESSCINYRAGEGMRELAKVWKEYLASGERNISVNGSGPTVEIRIPAELATTANRKIRVSHLWGTDIYTDDSDIVAVLFHTGYCAPSASLPPNLISELRATIRIFESQKMYTSSLRNTVRSRAWGSGSGCSYSVERCRILKQGGGIVELEPCLTRTPPLFPTLAQAASERTVTTRAASSSAHRQQRFMQEVTIQYNLCNEPWPKYNMSIVHDRGLKKSQFTSARLKRGDVLYVENHVHRYELAYDGERATCNGATTAPSLSQGTSGVEKAKEKNGSAERALEATEKEAILRTHSGDKPHGNHPNNGQVGGHCQPHELYRWSKCKRPLPLSSMKRKGLPLPEECVEVLEEGLTWEEVQWSPTSVWIREIEYILNIALFFSPDEL